jgi:hypothetical protein
MPSHVLTSSSRALELEMIPMQKIEEVGKKRGKITPPIFSDVVFL